MKPLAENRHVERILSLLVILYGLRLVIPCIEEIPLYTGWLPILPRATVGCLLIIFFPRVVQAIGYFATAGKPRQHRRWHAREIVAVPIILLAFTEFLFFVYGGMYLVALLIYDYNIHSNIGWDYYNWTQPLAMLQNMTGYFIVTILLLLYARHIATWFLRIVER
jgi:hypothetical protein